MEFKTVLVVIGLFLCVAFFLVMLGVLKVAKRADEQSEEYYRRISCADPDPLAETGERVDT